MISRQNAAPDTTATSDRRRILVGCSPDSAGRPRLTGVAGADCPPRKREAPPAAAASRATLLLAIDHFGGEDSTCDAGRKRLVNEWAFASLSRTKRALDDAVADLLSSWLSRCGRVAEAGRRRGRGARRVGNADPVRGDR
jgi:hypothetical protein